MTSKGIEGARCAGAMAAVALAASLRVAAASPASDPAASGTPAPAAAASLPATASPPASARAGSPMHYLPNRFGGRAGHYYPIVWGVDSLSVRMVESGEILRFAWRVVDPRRAQVLNDKRVDPVLVAPRSHVQLAVPAVEQIGQLRQSSAPEAGRSYWMAFSNRGGLVHRGDRVDVVVGTFRAEGLVVD